MLRCSCNGGCFTQDGCPGGRAKSARPTRGCHISSTLGRSSSKAGNVFPVDRHRYTTHSWLYSSTRADALSAQTQTQSTPVISYCSFSSGQDEDHPYLLPSAACLDSYLHIWDLNSHRPPRVDRCNNHPPETHTQTLARYTPHSFPPWTRRPFGSRSWIFALRRCFLPRDSPTSTYNPTPLSSSWSGLPIPSSKYFF